MRKLQTQIDGLEKQRADDRKWIVESARRIDSIESQVREQTREAMDYAREKCGDLDGRLRALDLGTERLKTELDDKVPKLLGDFAAKSKEHTDDVAKALETKTIERIKCMEALLEVLETKTAERIKGMEALLKAHDDLLKAHDDQAKQHEAYLQRLHNNSKPEDTQNMAGGFKYFDEELNKMKVVMADPVHKQKILDEAKRMMHDALHEIKTDYDGKIGQVMGTGILQTGQTDERIKTSRRRLW